MSESGFIYILSDPLNNLVKIGRSRLNPHARIVAHNNSLPYPLHTILVFEVEDYKTIEKEIHYHFKNQKFKTEWFFIDVKSVILYLFSKYEKEVMEAIDIKQTMMNILSYRVHLEQFIALKDGIHKNISFKKQIKTNEVNAYVVAKNIADELSCFMGKHLS